MTTRSGQGNALARSNPVRVRFDHFELDEANARLLRDEKALALAPTPFALLCALVRHGGTLLTKHALLDEVWGHQFVSDSVLKTAISEIRTALDDNPRQPRFIETVSRRGYRFIAPTIPVAPQTSISAARISSAQAQSFIGRAEALSRLRTAWDLACTGKRMVVWVAGEPGIGKTTLIEHFIASLHDVTCVRGQCVEQYGSGEPYLPVLEALEELCRRDSTVAPLLRAVAPSWLLRLPWLSTAEERDALRRELAGVAPDRMLREMGEAFDRYTEGRPLLLVTEDLHWSDRATIQLIDYIARRRGTARLIWLATFRLAEVVALDHPLSSLRRELRLHDLCDEIVLDPFSEREVADYVAQRAPSIAADEAFVRALHERTDGMPLFLASVVSDVIANAGQADGLGSAAGQVAKMAVPDNLAAIIEHYIAKRGNEQRALLSAAAVCGVEFRVNTIAAAMDRDAAWVGDNCEELAREQLWLAAAHAHEGSDPLDVPYLFRHALFRQVLYERTAPALRVQLHRKVGVALERERGAGRPVTAAQLAVHFELGRDLMTALRYYADASEAALLDLSPSDSMTLAERGLALLNQAPEGAERNAAEIKLATLRGVAAAQVLGIGSAEAKGAFERAYSLIDHVPQHSVRRLLLHGLGFVLTQRAEYAAALAVAERAEALAAATDDPVLLVGACTVQAEVQMLQGRPSAARGWAERGLAAIASLDAAPERTFVADPQVTMLGLLGIQLLHLGLVNKARGLLQQAHQRSHEVAQPMAHLAAIWFDALFELRLGNPEGVAALAEEMQALVEKFALAQGRAACHWFGGWANARMGEPREGYQQIRDGYEENIRLGMQAGGSETLGYAAEALLLAGDWDAAQHELEEALQIADTYGERVYLPQLFLIEAAIARARGQSSDGHASARRAIAEARTQEAPWLELIALLDLCEHGGATAKERRALAALVDRLPEAVDTTAYKRARALLDRTKAV